jgi:hypothetical protein
MANFESVFGGESVARGVVNAFIKLKNRMTPQLTIISSARCSSSSRPS